MRNLRGSRLSPAFRKRRQFVPFSSIGTHVRRLCCQEMEIGQLKLVRSGTDGMLWTGTETNLWKCNRAENNNSRASNRAYLLAARKRKRRQDITRKPNLFQKRWRESRLHWRRATATSLPGLLARTTIPLNSRLPYKAKALISEVFRPIADRYKKEDPDPEKSTGQAKSVGILSEGVCRRHGCATSDKMTNELAKIANSCHFGSGKRDSNPRHQPWQGCALPTELFPRTVQI
jgi:hypothetical protein